MIDIGKREVREYHKTRIQMPSKKGVRQTSEHSDLETTTGQMEGGRGKTERNGKRRDAPIWEHCRVCKVAIAPLHLKCRFYNSHSGVDANG